jgi:hypothetical protein
VSFKYCLRHCSGGRWIISGCYFFHCKRSLLLLISPKFDIHLKLNSHKQTSTQQVESVNLLSLGRKLIVSITTMSSKKINAVVLGVGSCAIVNGVGADPLKAKYTTAACADAKMANGKELPDNIDKKKCYECMSEQLKLLAKSEDSTGSFYTAAKKFDKVLAMHNAVIAIYEHLEDKRGVKVALNAAEMKEKYKEIEFNTFSYIEDAITNIFKKTTHAERVKEANKLIWMLHMQCDHAKKDGALLDATTYLSDSNAPAGATLDKCEGAPDAKKLVEDQSQLKNLEKDQVAIEGEKQ